jgi:hypothetical protein
MSHKTLVLENSTPDVIYLGKSRARCEIVTVVMRMEDYLKLKEVGGPRPDQIHMALNHYLEMISKTGWRPKYKGPSRLDENVTAYKCTLPKSLCEDVRNLKGRFDDHTIEAVRLFLR